MGEIDGCSKFIDSALKKCFFRLGYVVGRNPGYFIIVPVLLTALCASGFQQMNYNYDPEYLFSPNTGVAKMERKTLESHFPTNYSEFKSSRISRGGRFGRLILVAKDNGNMLRTDLWDQLLYLNQVVFNVSVEYQGSIFTYRDICARWGGYCYDNEILRLANVMPSVESGQINITYPVYFDPITFETYTLPAFFGGVSLSDLDTVTGVKAVALSYFLDVSEKWRCDLGQQWERQFLDDITKWRDYYAPDLEIGMFVSNTPAWEMEASKNSVTTTLCINIFIMVIFSFLSCISSDATKSKPWLGFGGLVSASIATLAGFGFACYVGVEFISLNFAAPFLLLGIGIDDTFVILSAWWRCPNNIPVEERLGKCYSEAAASITVTSLTDFLSFMAGVITPFPCVRIFCLYTGISIAFIYVWHLTLFGAFLAISGKAEKKNLHGFFCVKVTPKSLAVNKSWLFRTFMTGGINPTDPHNPKDNQDHAGMVFFRDKLGVLLNKTWFKAIVLLLFGAYIVVACWGITNIKEGLEKKNTANYDSYSVKYYSMDDMYFRKYAFAISVIITPGIEGREIFYSDPITQEKIENIVQALENSTYIDENTTQSWLRDFLDYIKRNEDYDDIEIPVDTEEEFIRTLETTYFSEPSNSLQLDVELNKEKTRILASRFLIQGYNIYNSYMEQKMVADLREICNRYSTSEIQVTVFHPFFIYIDQYLAITPQTIQCILVTSLIMMLVSFILIPSLVCSLWVAFSIFSIEVGVLGYMTWWGVSLDGVALINLIMCIGFSVDFSAHICYHYISDKKSAHPEDRIRASLYALGLPIVQGAVSTILGVIGLAFAPSYLFVTFFKMVFLVILLGGLHGLLILPILLSLFGPGSCRSKSKSLVSTPSTTISCRMRKPACYTVNFGYISDGSLSSTPTQNHRSVSSSPVFSTKEQQTTNGFQKHPQDFPPTPRRLAYCPGRASSPIPDYAFHSKRLTPVIESEEHNQQLAIINRLRSTANPAAMALPSQRIRHHHHHHRRPDHKRVCRSKSHRPESVSPQNNREIAEQQNSHAPLRKYHSFPYEMFNNETGYSSDESIRSVLS